MELEAAQRDLEKLHQRLERYRANLRLAGLEIKRRNQYIKALNNFAALASRLSSPLHLLQVALEQSLRTIGSPVGAVVLVDTQNGELVLGAHKGLSAQLMHIFTGQEWGGGASVLMPHLVAGQGALLEYCTATDDDERMLLAAGRLSSLVSLPLQNSSQLVGAFLVGLRERERFTPAEIFFLMALVQEMTLVLERLQLRDRAWNLAETLLEDDRTPGGWQSLGQAEPLLDASPGSADFPLNLAPDADAERHDLEQLLATMMKAEDRVQQQNADLLILHVFSKMMSLSLDLEQILQQAVRETQKFLKTDAVWLYLATGRSRLRLSVQSGLSPATVRAVQYLEPGEGLVGRVFVENKPGFLEAIANKRGVNKIWAARENFHTMAAAPLAGLRLESSRSGQEPELHTLGVLVVGLRATTGRSWGQREMRLLSAIANRLVLALNNARLYAQVRENEANTRAGHEALRHLNDILLEKNALMEGFLRDDLTPGLQMALDLLRRLQANQAATLSKSQLQQVKKLQQVIDSLRQSSQQTDEVSTVFESEFSRVVAEQEPEEEAKKAAQKKVTKPLGLRRRRRR